MILLQRSAGSRSLQVLHVLGQSLPHIKRISRLVKCNTEWVNAARRDNTPLHAIILTVMTAFEQFGALWRGETVAAANKAGFPVRRDVTVRASMKMGLQAHGQPFSM